MLMSNRTDTIVLALASTDLAAQIERAQPGLRVIRADSLQDALDPGRKWCFVDWLLPEGSGLEMCRWLRRVPGMADSHVTMILDEDDSEMRRRALRAGADDYMPGPLTPEALAARLHFHRAGPAAGPAGVLTHGELAVDHRAHQLRWRGKAIALPPAEFRLLSHFMEHPDSLHSRASLKAVLARGGADLDERTIDVYVGRLRRALRSHGIPDNFRTVRSLGYVLDSPN